MAQTAEGKGESQVAVAGGGSLSSHCRVYVASMALQIQQPACAVLSAQLRWFPLRAPRIQACANIIPRSVSSQQLNSMIAR